MDGTIQSITGSQEGLRQDPPAPISQTRNNENTD